MSYFLKILETNNLSKHNGRPLWKYYLTDSDFEELKKHIRFGTVYNIDPRDITLYHSYWWKNNYNGGKPSKEEVIESIGGNIIYDIGVKDFFKLAKQGAEMLRIKWIKKQNTLYFKTLLLQGGLPLRHIAENKTHYKKFLEAVLYEQPETIEDFIFNPEIIQLLPESSRNDVIYENCLEIVKSIMDDDGIFDELLNSNESITEIATGLRVINASLEKKVRISKPKNYWILRMKEGQSRISLRIGIQNIQSADDLANILGLEPTEREYKLFIDDNLVCVFRRLNNEKYKTDWFTHKNLEWDSFTGIPNTFVIYDGKKKELLDFIDIIPNLSEPSLWSKFSKDEWRLMKGDSTPIKEAAILFPNKWLSDLPAIDLIIENEQMFWSHFDGEFELRHEEIKRFFYSNVSTFDWNIVNEQPKWMLRANMPVVKDIPRIHIYDKNDQRVQANRINLSWREYNKNQEWTLLNRFLPEGCIEIKIEMDKVIAYDRFYKLGSLGVNYSNQAIDSASIEFKNNTKFQIQLYETEYLSITKEINHYELNLNVKNIIPNSIKSAIGIQGQIKLFFEITIPFVGVGITNNKGELVNEKENISLSDLHGMRILSIPGKTTLLQIKNTLKPNVIISKEINESVLPILSFRDEVVRLFYLADAMNHKNSVTLEFSCGLVKQSYQVQGFSHTLNVREQFDKKVSLYNSTDELELYAVPLNCHSSNVEVIPLPENKKIYEIPTVDFTNQFIVISTKVNGKQLMPRFINTDEIYIGIPPLIRIYNYSNNYMNNDFTDESWKELLAYFEICIQYALPFSTFDQLRAISRDSLVAAKAFLYLGLNYPDTEKFIQEIIPELEQDIGFCFHWVSKENWSTAIEEINILHDFKYLEYISSLLSNYFTYSVKQEMFQFISGGNIKSDPITRRVIQDLRAGLGERVMNELPEKSSRTMSNYNINIEGLDNVRLLIQAPISVAESIGGIKTKYPIWGGEDRSEIIRRNIQYSQYLNPEFYNKIIMHVLNTL